MEDSTFSSALSAREIAAAHYLANPRVTLIDIGYRMKDGEYTGELAVRVHVRKKPSQAIFELMSLEAPGLVIEKEKIPFPVVDIIEGAYPLQRGWWYSPPAEPRARAYNPLKGGISVSCEWLYGYGTLGGIVEDRITREKMILSNWHVLAGSEYAMPGLRIFQPAYGDGGSGADTVALLERHAFAQGVDAAVARLTGSRGWTNEEDGLGPVNGATAPLLGMRVVKSGRASGITYGVIDGIEGDYPIYYGGMLHRIHYVNRIVPQPGRDEVSRGGDSGSWWLEESTRLACGLHFAGQDNPETALGIAMPQVLDALKVDIAAATTPAPEARAASPTAERVRV
jgi:endonuclease G